MIKKVIKKHLPYTIEQGRICRLPTRTYREYDDQRMNLLIKQLLRKMLKYLKVS